MKDWLTVVGLVIIIALLFVAVGFGLFLVYHFITNIQQDMLLMQRLLV